MNSARQWWTQSNHSKLLAAQTKLFDTLVPNRTAESLRVANINAVSFMGGNSSGPTCVLAHGFGSGLGFFYRNINPILDSGRYSRLILVDWLGMGGSDRPSCLSRPYRSMTGWCDADFTPDQATRFFIDPLKKLLDDEVDGQIHLVGHSLGGYLAARYALSYPDRLSKLVLASPVGFPNKPENVFAAAQMPTTLRLVDALWSANVTPQTLVRLQGATRGRRNVKRILQGRIGTLNPEHVETVAEYLYHITVAAPSGEYAMNSLLSPAASPDVMGVFAREPLEERLANLDKNIALRICFGDHDWMRPNEPSARRVVEMLRRRNANHDALVDIAPNAGHHVYMDSIPSFTKAVID